MTLEQTWIADSIRAYKWDKSRVVRLDKYVQIHISGSLLVLAWLCFIVDIARMTKILKTALLPILSLLFFQTLLRFQVGFLVRHELNAPVGLFLLSLARDAVVAGLPGILVAVFADASLWGLVGRLSALLLWWGLGLAVLIDFGFFCYGGSHLDPAFWSYLSISDFQSIHSSILEQVTRPAVLAMTGLLIALGIWNVLRVVRFRYSAPRWKRLTVGGLLLVAIVSIHVFANQQLLGFVPHQSGFGRNLVMEFIGRLLVKRSPVEPPSEGEARELWKWTMQGARYQPKGPEFPWVRVPVQGSPLLRRKNVLFLMLESYGALSVSPLSPFYQRTTPEFARLSNEGVLFTRVYNNAIPTAPAMASVLCSFPDFMGIWRRYPDRSLRCGPSILADQGYHTASLMPCDPDYDNMRGFMRQHGYRSIWGQDDYASIPHPSLIPTPFGRYNDEETLHETLFKMDAMVAEKKPFFMTVFTVSNHDPFPQYGPQYMSEEGKGKRRRMHSTMRFVDHALGDFISEFKKRDYYRDTIIVIFGDHPSWFSETPAEDPAYGDLFLHSWIPVLILNPVGFQPGSRQDEVMSQVDIMPTVLDMLGLSETTSFSGSSLLDSTVPSGERYAFATTPAQEYYLMARSKRGMSRDRAGRLRFFDLSRHPGPSIEISPDSDRKEFERLKRGIETFRKAGAWALETQHVWSRKFEPGSSIISP